jgi:hypothetical protein
MTPLTAVNILCLGRGLASFCPSWADRRALRFVQAAEPVLKAG